MQRPALYTGTRRRIGLLGGLTAVVGLAVGCQAGGGEPAPTMQSSRSSERIAAIIAAAERGDSVCVPLLVDRLDDEDRAVRFCAVVALEKLTGTRLGFRYGVAAEERSAAVDRWRAYLSPVEDRDGGGEREKPSE